MIEIVKLPQQTQIILFPNRSATWKESKYFMWFIGFTMLLVAGGWSVVGVWIVLPFAGLELALFSFLRYRVSLATYSKQVVTLTADNVNIVSGYKQLSRHTLDARHIEITLTESENNWPLPILTISDNQKQLELGEFLNLEDRLELYTQLRSLGVPACRTHWWKNDR